MDKRYLMRHLIVIYLLLAIIIVLLVILVNQNAQLQNDVVNIGNHVSEKLDHLTSTVKTYLIEHE